MSTKRPTEPSDPLAFAASLSQQLPDEQGSYPPVHLWNPEFCGDIDMRIAADGRWYYMGSPIGRPAMVKLFSSILRYDDDGCFYLVTPVEKVRIQVEDAPLIVTHMSVHKIDGQQQLHFKTHVDDAIIASQAHPIVVRYPKGDDEPRPYLLARAKLEARLHRNVFYQLVELAQSYVKHGVEHVYVESCGAHFDLGAVE